MARTGRRPGNSGAREAILASAQELFSSVGFQRATIREVAREAGVDPALVHHYFGTKDDLFVAVLDLPANPGELLPGALAGDPDGLGERIVWTFLKAWDGQAGQRPLLALVRSATSNESAARMVREFVEHTIRARLATVIDADDAPLRTALAASQMAGLAITRYVLRLEPLASAPPATVVAAIGPTIQRYLRGDLDA